MGFQLFRLDRSSFDKLRTNGVARAEVAVNRASVEELAALPGIGPVLAERILRDRKLHGRYLTLGDLKRVKGMTPKALDKLKGYLRFD
jgi:competence protein ComEA